MIVKSAKVTTYDERNNSARVIVDHGAVNDLQVA